MQCELDLVQDLEASLVRTNCGNLAGTLAVVYCVLERSGICEWMCCQFGRTFAIIFLPHASAAVVWQKFQCRVMGTASQGIRTTEDRDLFAIACKEIGESFCESNACASVAVCIDADDKQEYPVTIFVTSIALRKTPDGLMLQFGSL